ncbi:MAG TPA: bifunctional UDP-N-acetylglucosamine diphosphorylase/glucosamine-1-phosphate N-acetyltransferase GlmU [Gammaproteobacteria bacterium]|nr:bifunctional UDP-N-acetylglucosamine diphosphorylase/glucosamine-1-phosphate N-acetyltransferase GlmU [Gammaproteobacteria bacterium]
MTTPLNIVILAAGMGTRMLSSTPKPLFPFVGQTLLHRVVTTAQTLNPDKIIVVYPPDHYIAFQSAINIPVTFVPQHDPQGTGHALLTALPQCDKEATILTLYGDVPLTPQSLLQQLLDTSGHNLGILTYDCHNPTGYGRIIRNDSGNPIKIIEEKDASNTERLIPEIFTGILTAPTSFLSKTLSKLQPNNQQNELYLTDLIDIWAKTHPQPVAAVKASDWQDIAGVNTPQQLVELERAYQYRYALQLLNQGIMIKDPNRFDCRGTLKAESGVMIDINVIIEGSVSIGKNSVIGAHSTLINSRVGENVQIHPYSHIESSLIDHNVSVGPFARIRPNCHLKEQSKVGNFVELKNTQLGIASKAGHLAYLGDSNIESNVNIGAGTITCNYDGVQKHTTLIKSGAFIGSNTSLIAPITIGENATIGAGSTLTERAPENALTLSRTPQQSIPGWNKKNKKDIKQSTTK